MDNSLENPVANVSNLRKQLDAACPSLWTEMHVSGPSGPQVVSRLTCSWLLFKWSPIL